MGLLTLASAKVQLFSICCKCYSSFFLYLRSMFVATIGFFDGVHCGHRFLIDRMKEVAEEENLRSMVVTMNRHPKTIVDAEYIPSLLTTTEERLALLRNTGVDRVEVLDFDREMAAMDARFFMKDILYDRFGVRVLLMGYDHRFGHGGGTHEDYVLWGAECGIRVVFAERLEGVYASSSEVRRMLSEGNVAGAAGLLGYHYMLSGIVERGHQIGRTIGFPTANLHISQEKLIPACGVYAVETNVGDGIMNIGHRPTLMNGKDLSIEVHVLNYSGNLYGMELRTCFVDRIREERPFPDIEALREQIQRDAREALCRLYAAKQDV